MAKEGLCFGDGAVDDTWDVVCESEDWVDPVVDSWLELAEGKIDVVVDTSKISRGSLVQRVVTS